MTISPIGVNQIFSSLVTTLFAIEPP